MTVRKPKSNVDFGYAAAELFAAREQGAGEEREGWEWDDDGGDDERRRTTEWRKKGPSSSSSSSVADAEADATARQQWTPRPGPGEGVIVYMDFAQGRGTWGLAQHKALEMVLTRYPEARVVVLQVAPGAWIFWGGGMGFGGVYGRPVDDYCSGCAYPPTSTQAPTPTTISPTRWA